LGGNEQLPLIETVSVPPQFCQYAGGACDQDFRTAVHSDLLFLSPSQPESVSATIDEAVNKLAAVIGPGEVVAWRNLVVQGQIIFCEYARASGLRSSSSQT
jgi:hypothetical protein